MKEEFSPEISFVSPVYKAERILDKLVSEIQKVMDEINQPYEVILVDDRSPDGSWQVMRKISSKFPEVKSIRLSRNFGQHPAIMAGLSMAKGEWVVVMDCDLQDQPKEVLKLYNKAKEGFDIVFAKRKHRKDGFLKKMSSAIFSKVYSFFTDTKYDNEIANFGIYNKKTIKSILEITDAIKFFPLFVKLVGFNFTSVVVEHAEREEGESSYSFSKLISLAFNTIISFSNKPLKLFVKFGITMSMISFLFGIYNIYLAMTNQIEVLGYSSIIVSVWFLSGIIITTIGVTGIYIGKIFDQTKNRPTFIIDEIV
ncbi:glycosyltransferase family 2 protein [Flavobacterium sp. H122]|uniref:glycosyltransferase family 2 protein n=1 Tax=Flavobacterium sp. H122 TaxID=2529860 RepID=UPI0010AB07EA|nr:glycosyltransferase family 2 protein [Flavobacterium sp. H122]